MANSIDIKILMNDDGTVSITEQKVSSAMKKVAEESTSAAKKPVGAWGEFKKTIEDNEKSISTLGTVLTAFGAVTTGVMGFSVHAAMGAEEANRKLTQAIQNAGLEATNTKEKVMLYSMQMQKMTGASDELFQTLVARVLPVTRDVDKAMQLVSASANYAAGAEKDLSGAGQILAQVAAGNIEMLKRSVSSLRDYSTEQLNSMSASQRMELAIKAINKEFAGQAEALGGSTQGRLNLLKETMGDLGEVIGGVLLPPLTRFAQVGVELFSKVNEWTQENKELTQAIVIGAAALGIFALGAGGSLLAVGKLISIIDTLAVVVLPRLVAAATTAWTAITGPAAPLVALLTGMGLVVTVIATNFGNLRTAALIAISGIVVALANLMQGFVKLKSMDFNGAWEQFKQAGKSSLAAVTESWGAIKFKADDTHKSLTNPSMVVDYQKMMGDMVASFGAGADAIKSKEKELADARAAIFSDVQNRLALMGEEGLALQLMQLDQKHADELQKLTSHQAAKAQIEELGALQKLERENFLSTNVEQLSTQNAENLKNIEFDLSQFGANQYDRQLADNKKSFDGKRKNLDKWHKDELALAKVQGKDTTEIESTYAKKNKEITEAEEIAKKTIKQQQQKAALSDFKSNLLELSKHSQTAFEAYKATAIVETIMSTYLGAQQAYTALSGIPIVGPALGGAAAAVAIAAGMSRVAAITSQQRPQATFHVGGYVNGTGEVPAVLEAGEYVIRKEQVQNTLPVLQAINQGRMQTLGGAAEQNITFNFYHYGDNNGKEDYQEMLRGFGYQLRNAVMGSTV